VISLLAKPSAKYSAGKLSIMKLFILVVLLAWPMGTIAAHSKSVCVPDLRDSGCKILRRLYARRSARLLEVPARVVAYVVKGLDDGAAPTLADGLEIRIVILETDPKVLMQ
jgi:hypothetical protein